MLQRIKEWFYIEPNLLQMETPAGRTKKWIARSQKI